MSKSPSLAASPSPKRAAILSAAKKAFLHHGYEISLEAIADEAGVARRTIFNNFRSKEELFRDVLEEMWRGSNPFLVVDDSRDIRSALLGFARNYVAIVVSPDTLAIQRLLLSGAPNLLEEMKRSMTRNYTRIVADLAKYFRGRIAAGEMRAVHSERAAERFITSVLGLARNDVMLGLEPDMSTRDLYIREAVTGFLDGVKPHAAADTMPR